MPSKEKVRIPFRCTDAYAEALERLRLAEGTDDLSTLAEVAFARLAKRHKIDLPERIGPVGRPPKGRA